MRRASQLKSLDRHAAKKFSRFERRARLLRFTRDDGGNILDVHQVEAELGSLVINIQSSLVELVPSFLPFRRFRDRHCGGQCSHRVHSAVRSEHDALTIAITRRLNPPNLPPPIWPSYQEPKWFAPDVFSRILNDAQLNVATFATMLLNSGTQGLSHLRTFRNYYGHRSESLKQEALLFGSHLFGWPRSKAL